MQTNINIDLDCLGHLFIKVNLSLICIAAAPRWTVSRKLYLKSSTQWRTVVKIYAQLINKLNLISNKLFVSYMKIIIPRTSSDTKAELQGPLAFFPPSLAPQGRKCLGLAGVISSGMYWLTLSHMPWRRSGEGLSRSSFARCQINAFSNRATLSKVPLSTALA